MDINDIRKKTNAPKNLSTETINEFISNISSVREMMEKGNNAACKDEITIKNIIADEDMLHDYLITHRENKDFKTVIQKVRLIDFLYSTNLRMSGTGIFTDIANIILETNNFDERVEKGCLDLVSDIAKSIKDITGTNHFSFVTKYCCNHNFHIYENDNYSIYDAALNKAIPRYLDVTYSCVYDECRGKMDYRLYHSIISKMIEEYGIKTENSRRDTDLYLWYLYR